MQTTLLDVARRYLGTKEREGTLDNPDIRAWLWRAGASIYGPDVHDEVPWCGAFVDNAAFVLELPRPSIAVRARSWLTVGRPVSLADARPGFDIAIFSRGAGGHVAVFVHADHGPIWVVGGNQANAVTFASYPLGRLIEIRRLYEEDR